MKAEDIAAFSEADLRSGACRVFYPRTLDPLLVRPQLYDGRLQALLLSPLCVLLAINRIVFIVSEAYTGSAIVLHPLSDLIRSIERYRLEYGRSLAIDYVCELIP